MNLDEVIAEAVTSNCTPAEQAARALCLEAQKLRDEAEAQARMDAEGGAGGSPRGKGKGKGKGKNAKSKSTAATTTTRLTSDISALMRVRC